MVSVYEKSIERVNESRVLASTISNNNTTEILNLFVSLQNDQGNGSENGTSFLIGTMRNEVKYLKSIQNKTPEDLTLINYLNKFMNADANNDGKTTEKELLEFIAQDSAKQIYAPQDENANTNFVHSLNGDEEWAPATKEAVLRNSQMILQKMTGQVAQSSLSASGELDVAEMANYLFNKMGGNGADQAKVRQFAEDMDLNRDGIIDAEENLAILMAQDAFDGCRDGEINSMQAMLTGLRNGELTRDDYQEQMDNLKRIGFTAKPELRHYAELLALSDGIGRDMNGQRNTKDNQLSIAEAFNLFSEKLKPNWMEISSIVNIIRSFDLNGNEFIDKNEAEAVYRRYNELTPFVA